MYSLMTGLAISYALWLVVRKESEQHQLQLLAAGLTCLAAALLGARLSFVSLHWGYYTDHLLEIPRIDMGGLWWPGALLFAVLALILFSHWSHISLPALADRLQPALLPLCSGLWLGCWLTGCAYGPTAPQDAWWGIPAPDESGFWAPRLPVQFLSLALLTVFTCIIEYWKPSLIHSGAAASLSLAALGFSLLPLALFRADYLPRLLGFRLDAWLALLVIFSGVAGWYFPSDFLSRGKAATCITPHR